MDLEMLKKRAAIIKQIRSFFDKKNYLELDTSLLAPDLIPESCLEVFQTMRLHPHGSKKEPLALWLIPSPEIWMKKIIAAHHVDVYQVCKCFRNGEVQGRLHNSEFTMLEYYTMNADYMDSLKLTEELIFFLTANCGQKTDIFERLTVAQAFEKYAAFDLFAAAYKGADAMAEQAQKLGLDPIPGMSVPQLYDLIFIYAVEPNLKSQKYTALIDYPAFVSCLAKKSPDMQTVERWELYYNGIELANCFSEETDPQKVKEFFIQEEAEKKRDAIVQHKVDHDYWKLFKNNGFPRCSGVAMGVDRLIMALTGKACIDGVLPG